MTRLFTFDDAMKTWLKTRKRAVVGPGGTDPSTMALGDLAGRVRAFLSDPGATGFYVHEQELLPKEVTMKHGPFIEYLVDRDLRKAQKRITRPLLKPQMRWELTKAILPTQVVGFRTGLEQLTRYEILWTDVIAAFQLYHELRHRKPVVTRRERGHIAIDYHDGINLVIHGLHKRTPGTIEGWLAGIPSERKQGMTHDTHYKLEAIARTPANGTFRIDSGYSQERTRNWDIYLYYDNPLTQEPFGHVGRHNPDTNRKATIDRTALYAGDILGLYLITGVALRQFGVEINQPLPLAVPTDIMRDARRIGEGAIIIDKRGRHEQPNKTQWNQLYSIAIQAERQLAPT